jgi:hypothetical protein
LPVRLSEASVLAPKSATFFFECIVSLSGPGNIGIERLQESLFPEYTLTDFEFLIELPAGRGSTITFVKINSKIIINNVYSLSGSIRGRSRLVVAVVAVMMVVVVMGLTNFELFVELPASRWCTMTLN